VLAVKGMFQNGVAAPLQVVEGRDGQEVIITFCKIAPTLKLHE